jgi:PKD repeat protein
MIKSIISAGVGLSMLATPLAASAQTSATSNSNLIAILTQLVQLLEQELQQLIAERQNTTPSQPTTPNTGGTFTASPTSGAAPLTVTFNMPAFFEINGNNNDAWTTLDNGDGEVSISGQPSTEVYDNIDCTAAAQDSVCQGSHTYTSPGTYTVALKDFSGNVLGTQTITVTASGSQPSAAILSASPASGNAPLTVEFHISAGSATPASIYFGDDKTNIETLGNGLGNSCGDPNASECAHTYQTPGTYTAQVYDANSNLLGTATVTVTGGTVSQTPPTTITVCSESTQLATNHPSATISESSLAMTSEATSVLSGTANVTSVDLQITGNGQTVNAANIPVSNSEWSATFPADSLSNGTYQITVHSAAGEAISTEAVLATGTLTVGAAPSSVAQTCM